MANFKTFKTKSYAGEKSIKRGAMVTGAAASSAGTAVAWFGTAGTFTKIGLAVGLVSPPVAMFAAAGVAGGIIAGTFAKQQLFKRDREWAEACLHQSSIK